MVKNGNKGNLYIQHSMKGVTTTVGQIWSTKWSTYIASCIIVAKAKAFIASDFDRFVMIGKVRRLTYI